MGVLAFRNRSIPILIRIATLVAICHLILPTDQCQLSCVLERTTSWNVSPSTKMPRTWNVRWQQSLKNFQWLQLGSVTAGGWWSFKESDVSLHLHRWHGFCLAFSVMLDSTWGKQWLVVLGNNLRAVSKVWQLNSTHHLQELWLTAMLLASCLDCCVFRSFTCLDSVAQWHGQQGQLQLWHWAVCLQL